METTQIALLNETYIAVLQMNGKVKLVKIDIDQNQSLAKQMQIQSVPTVLAFFEGKPVNGFAGMKSEEEVMNFITEVANLTGHSSEHLKNPQIENDEDNSKDVLAKNENNDNLDNNRVSDDPSEENVNLRIKPKKMIFKV